MYAYITNEDRDAFHKTLDLCRRGDADRVREDELARLEPLAELEDATGIDASFEGTAEGDADRRRRRQLGRVVDRLGLLGRLLQGHVPVAPVERLRRRE